MATARKASKPTPVTFPTLPIGIYRDGKLIRKVELPDPRPAAVGQFEISAAEAGAGPVAGYSW